jgi:Rrf2 family nitric oxide-sensitive transcriptional repressor
MKLTAYTNYALRMLMYAALNNNEVSSIQDVSKAYGISANHLKKAAAEMAEHGYLTPHQGRYGGYVLAKNPQDIVIGEVVRITEGDLKMVECFNPETNTCPLIEVCRLSRLFKKALRAFLDVLDEVTLADVVASPKELQSLLNISQQ